MYEATQINLKLSVITDASLLGRNFFVTVISDIVNDVIATWVLSLFTCLFLIDNSFPQRSHQLLSQGQSIKMNPVILLMSHV